MGSPVENPRFWRPVLYQLSYAPRLEKTDCSRVPLSSLRGVPVGILFMFLCVCFLGVGYAAARAGGGAWVIAVAAVAIALWLGNAGLAILRRSYR
jgi:hypothetical protein